jgi:hypothetical protein
VFDIHNIVSSGFGSGAAAIVATAIQRSASNVDGAGNPSARRGAAR